jgi:hypothetical protein
MKYTVVVGVQQKPTSDKFDTIQQAEDYGRELYVRGGDPDYRVVFLGDES